MKFCKDCWFFEKDGSLFKCRLSGNNGVRLQCFQERGLNGSCGPDGKNFTPFSNYGVKGNCGPNDQGLTP